MELDSVLNLDQILTIYLPVCLPLYENIQVQRKTNKDLLVIEREEF